MQVDLFALMQSRLNWTQQRQTALAENIANANTPRYQPRDVPDFAARLARQPLPLAATAASHIVPARADPLRLLAEPAKQKSIDGNAVSLESELTKMADTETAQQVTTQLYTTYMGMFRTAIGKG